MSHLVLELRPGETMLVNGASIRFRNRCRVELVSKARFLFGKQIMEPQDDASAVEKLYCAIQTMYVGPSAEAGLARAGLDILLTDLGPAAIPGTIDPAATIREMVKREDLYGALKILRSATRTQDHLTGGNDVLER